MRDDKGYRLADSKICSVCQYLNSIATINCFSCGNSTFWKILPFFTSSDKRYPPRIKCEFEDKRPKEKS